mmetsp:Transcript_48592/g.141533  ORF Transcript_48592/g.141533 Transcript_48592/m.141533 type:complete len:99 (-) Transcript_48592:584-880(-)
MVAIAAAVVLRAPASRLPFSFFRWGERCYRSQNLDEDNFVALRLQRGHLRLGGAVAQREEILVLHEHRSGLRRFQQILAAFARVGDVCNKRSAGFNDN